MPVRDIDSLREYPIDRILKLRDIVNYVDLSVLFVQRSDKIWGKAVKSGVVDHLGAERNLGEVGS